MALPPPALTAGRESRRTVRGRHSECRLVPGLAAVVARGQHEREPERDQPAQIESPEVPASDGSHTSIYGVWATAVSSYGRYLRGAYARRPGGQPTGVARTAGRVVRARAATKAAPPAKPKPATAVRQWLRPATPTRAAMATATTNSTLTAHRLADESVRG